MNKYEKIANEWLLSLGALIKNDLYIANYKEQLSEQENIFQIWLLETTHSIEQAAELVRDYGVALEYDNGDLELLKKAFPNDDLPDGVYNYYYNYNIATTRYWGVSNKTDRPIIKLSSVGESNQAIDLDGQEFYDLMQLYRIAPVSNQEFVIERFEAVKNFIKQYCKK